jgi:hypothetical protein
MNKDRGYRILTANSLVNSQSNRKTEDKWHLYYDVRSDGILNTCCHTEYDRRLIQSRALCYRRVEHHSANKLLLTITQPLKENKTNEILQWHQNVHSHFFRSCHMFYSVRITEKQKAEGLVTWRLLKTHWLQTSLPTRAKKTRSGKSSLAFREIL